MDNTKQYTANVWLKTFIFFLLISVTQLTLNAQNAWPSQAWTSAVNLTPVIDATSGLTELSGLHWNPDLNRLYVIDDHGNMYILALNINTNKFTRIGTVAGLGGPEGVTQIDYTTNEFYTIDETSYQIRKYTHSASFSNVILSNSWNLLGSSSPMTDTGNTGPEGITFIPDSYLKSIGFISTSTGAAYTSTKGMGGLIFLAHQKKGYVWVFDLNPTVSNDFTYVGKYKTNEDESCDLAFDRSTGLLYILHNTGSNYLEVTNLSTSIVSGERKFVTKNEYNLPQPSGNTNIEGFAITPKCDDSTHVSAWLCRDVASDESTSYQQDCLRWFTPFTADGACKKSTDNEEIINNAIKISPNPANNKICISVPEILQTKVIIKLYNLIGLLVMSGWFENQQQVFDISSLTKGVYIVETNVNGHIFTKRLIKN